MKVGDLVTATLVDYKRQGVILSFVKKTELPHWLTGGKQIYMVYCVGTPQKIHELRERDLKPLSENK